MGHEPNDHARSSDINGIGPSRVLRLVIAGQFIISIRQMVEKGAYPLSSRLGCQLGSFNCYQLPAGRWALMLRNTPCFGDNEEGG